MLSANVPAIVYDKGMSAFAPQSDRVRDYLQSGAYREDLQQRRGIYLWGQTPRRSDIFAIIAKIFVLNGMSVYHTTLHSLVGIIEHDAERKSMVGRIDHLFVDNIQKRYTVNPDECPYPRYLMAELEELLEYRRTHAHMTHLSSSLNLDKLTWINKDTVELLRGVLTPINL